MDGRGDEDMRGQSIVYETLRKFAIPYEEIEHEPVWTVEDLRLLALPRDAAPAKNLFLRDAKGKRHFLLTIHMDKPVDLKRASEALACSRLSFASPERLARRLKLLPGSVSPFGILNDDEREVEVAFDSELENWPRIAVHPNVNTATLVLAFADMAAIVRSLDL